MSGNRILTENSVLSRVLSEVSSMSRRFEQKKRGEVLKKKRPAVFIAAEGHNRTERNYFKGFASRHKNLSIKMVPDSSTDPVGMAESLADFMDDSGFSLEDGDMAFCLIDHDCNYTKDSQIAQALQIAQEKGFYVIVSNPCFEIWFICHFTSTPKNYSSSKEVIKDLDSYIPGYGKSDIDVFIKTESRLSDAISVAKRLEEKCSSLGYIIHRHDFSPSTEVFKMIEMMLAIDYKG